MNAGRVPFKEEGAEEILREALSDGTLKATSDMNEVRKADAVIFVTGTPVDEHLNPRIKDITSVIKLYLPYMNPLAADHNAFNDFSRSLQSN